jgi:uncharacterized membrane protein
MGWIGTAFKTLFKGKIDIGEAFGSVSKGIDNLGLTAQEKADSVKEFVKETLSESTERSKARRDIAKFFIVNYFLVFWVAVVSAFINVEITKLIIEIAAAFSLGYAFLAIIAFYFGGYYLGKYRYDKKKKTT